MNTMICYLSEVYPVTIIRQNKKKKCVSANFQVTGLKILGRVGSGKK